jgi:DHA2 family multidrug resistance protein
METGFRKWIIVITIITSTIIELIDTTIVNVSINTMSGNLGSTLEDTAWVITSYAIANVIIIPMTSFLAQTFGRKQYYIGSILLFTAASACCGFSTSLWELVFFRFCQGIGGGALLSTSQAILFETFSVKERGLASGIFSLGVIVGPSIGPVLGGYIVDNYQWQWIFNVNIPIGLLAAFLSFIYLRDTPKPTVQKSIDWWGILLLIAGIGSLQVVLERGQTDDWFAANYIVALTATSVISLLLLVWRQLSIDNPVINLKVLKSGTLAISAIMTFVLGFGLLSALFVFPLYTQRIIGYTAFQTGTILLPGTMMAALISPFLGKMLQSGIRPQYLIICGFGLTAAFGFMMSRNNLESGDANFLLALIFRGLGAALLIVPLTALAVSDLKPADIPQGASLNNMMRQMGGSFGIALTNTYIAHREAINRTALITHVTASDAITLQRRESFVRNFMAHGANYLHAVQQSIEALERTVVRQTFLLSYMDAFLLLAILNALCIPLVVITIKRRPVVKMGKIEIPDAH